MFAALEFEHSFFFFFFQLRRHVVDFLICLELLLHVGKKTKLIEKLVLIVKY